MKTKVKTITPEMATEMLKGNTTNRNPRQAHVDALASEMTNDRWLLTHQGICIASDGTLLDGQHRLLAIKQSGRSVEMLVTTDADAGLMDAVDVGLKPRSVGDMLHLVDGISDASTVASACRHIASMCCYYQGIVVSVGFARFMMSQFQPQIEAVIEKTAGNKLARRGWVVGTLAFCLRGDKNALPFIEKVGGSGADLGTTDPALALRNWLSGSSVHIKRGFKRGATECVCNAAFNAVQKRQLTTIKSGISGLTYFQRNQEDLVRKIRAQQKDQLSVSDAA